MSKRKRDVSFIKPDEPSFISRMKAQAGYKEGPTVDTKRETLPSDEEDIDDRDDEQPQVVVVKEGDLTADEAAKAKIEQENAPANLNERIVFRKPEKSKEKTKDTTEECDKKRVKQDQTLDSNSKGKGSSKVKKGTSCLSFNEDDEENNY